MKYYKHVLEMMDGPDGEYFSEVKDGLIVRQIIVIGERVYWATLHDEADDLYAFTDQPEWFPNDLDTEIKQAEFEELWTAGGGPPTHQPQ